HFPILQKNFLPPPRQTVDIVYTVYIQYFIREGILPPSSGNGPPGGGGGKEVDAVNNSISKQNGKPIYEQRTEQIKALIWAGQLKEGDPLPSMRLLAQELRISVITTKRAYEELEREGFLYTLTGKGSFVAGKNAEFLREEQLRQVE